MKTYLTDANVWLRYLLNDIPQQADTAEIYLKQAKEGKISLIVSFIVIIELVFTLTKFYRWERQEVVHKLIELIEVPQLKIEKREALIKAMQLYSEQNISFVDAILVTEAQLNKYELLTFDKKLQQLLPNH